MKKNTVFIDQRLKQVKEHMSQVFPLSGLENLLSVNFKYKMKPRTPSGEERKRKNVQLFSQAEID